MKISRGIAVALAATILASGGGITAAVADATPAYAASSQQEIEAAIQRIFADSNAERVKQGLEPLKLAPAMNSISQSWSEAMSARQSMGHNPNYFRSLPRGWASAGENVAQGYKPETVVQAWMNSETHRNNLLGDYTHIGLGYVVDDAGRAWFTQTFALYDIVETPSPVTGLNTEVRKDSFTSSWETSSSLQSSLDYVVTLLSSDGLVIDKKTTSTPEITFSGLNESTTYKVSISARTTDIPGVEYVSPETSFDVTTLEDVPTVTAPVSLSTTTGETSLQATWAAPESIYGTLQSYEVELWNNGALVNTAQTTSLTHNFDGLKSNTEYTVKVIATATLKGKTASSNTVTTARTALSSAAEVSAPQNLTLTAISDTSVKAQWTAPEVMRGTALKYVVALETTGQANKVVETTSLNHNFSNLTPATNYKISVKAVITSENGRNQATSPVTVKEISTLTDQSKVSTAPVTQFTVDASADRAQLKWVAPKISAGKLLDYTVTVRQQGKADRVFTTVNPNYLVTGLSENSEYTFSVKANAVSLNGKNRMSSEPVTLVKKTPYAPTTVIVGAPQKLTVKASAWDRLDMSWVAPSNVVGTLRSYEVKVKTGTTTVSTKTVTTTNTTVTGLKEGVTYTVEVRATALASDKKTSKASSPATATVKTPVVAAAPKAPTALKASPSHDSANISWVAPTGVIGKVTAYTVTVSQTGKSDRLFRTTNTSYKVTGLSENTAYTVRVAAEVTSADGKRKVVSPTASVAVKTAYAPTSVKVSAPTGVKLSSITHDSMVASWAAPTGTVGKITGYTVTVKVGSSVKKTVTVTSTSTKITGLTPNTKYTVEVKANAVSANGTKKAASTAGTVNGVTAKSPVVKVAAPNVSTSKVSHDRFTASWTKPTVTGSITGYKVIVKQGSKILQSHNLNASTLSRTITGLKENTAYTVVVEVSAVAPNGKNTTKATSQTKTVKTSLTAASTVKVSNPSVTVSSARNSVSSSWKKPAVTGKIVNYTITLKEGTRVVKTSTTTKTSMTFTGLKANTNYTVQVKANAQSSNGKYKASSGLVSKSIKTKR